MIPHSYGPACSDSAQYEADECDRQEITLDFYIAHLTDVSVFRHLPDQSEFDLDPWRITSDPAYDFHPERGERLFAQRRDLAARGLPTGDSGRNRPPVTTASHNLGNGWTFHTLSNGGALFASPRGPLTLTRVQVEQLRGLISSGEADALRRSERGSSDQHPNPVG